MDEMHPIVPCRKGVVEAAALALQFCFRVVLGHQLFHLVQIRLGHINHDQVTPCLNSLMEFADAVVLGVDTAEAAQPAPCDDGERAHGDKGGQRPTETTPGSQGNDEKQCEQCPNDHATLNKPWQVGPVQDTGRMKAMGVKTGFILTDNVKAPVCDSPFVQVLGDLLQAANGIYKIKKPFHDLPPLRNSEFGYMTQL